MFARETRIIVRRCVRRSWKDCCEFYCSENCVVRLHLGPRRPQPAPEASWCFLGTQLHRTPLACCAVSRSLSTLSKPAQRSKRRSRTQEFKVARVQWNNRWYKRQENFGGCVDPLSRRKGTAVIGQQSCAHCTSVTCPPPYARHSTS